jgi:hypothetical protein
MRVEFPIATRTCYHVMSLDISQCHERTVPKLSQVDSSRSSALDALHHLTLLAEAVGGIAESGERRFDVDALLAREGHAPSAGCEDLEP